MKPPGMSKPTTPVSPLAHTRARLWQEKASSQRTRTRRSLFSAAAVLRLASGPYAPRALRVLRGCPQRPAKVACAPARRCRAQRW
jgi:hypothetical protein